jgi:hypothetical protein
VARYLDGQLHMLPNLLTAWVSAGPMCHTPTMAKGQAGKQFDRFDRAWEFPGAFTATVVMVGLLVFLLVAWPTVAFHGTARWIGEALWVGIPTFIAGSLFMAVRWSQRDERKLERLRNERLWAEGRHPEQLRVQQMRQGAAQSAQAAALRCQQVEAMNRAEKEAARAYREQVRNAIREEERLREVRSRGGSGHGS